MNARRRPRLERPALPRSRPSWRRCPSRSGSTTPSGGWSSPTTPPSPSPGWSPRCCRSARRSRDIVRLYAYRGVYGPGDPEAQVGAAAAARPQPAIRGGCCGAPTAPATRSTAVPLPGGGSFSIAVDVTRHQAAIAEAAEQARRLEAVLAQLRSGLAVFDPERRLALSNPAYEELIGLPRGAHPSGDAARRGDARDRPPGRLHQRRPRPVRRRPRGPRPLAHPFLAARASQRPGAQPDQPAGAGRRLPGGDRRHHRRPPGGGRGAAPRRGARRRPGIAAARRGGVRPRWPGGDGQCRIPVHHGGRGGGGRRPPRGHRPPPRAQRRIRAGRCGGACPAESRADGRQGAACGGSARARTAR